MGEMAHYTPGAHLLAVLLGAWTGTDGLRAFYPLLAACAAPHGGIRVPDRARARLACRRRSRSSP